MKLLWLAGDFPGDESSYEGWFNVTRTTGLRDYAGFQSEVINPVWMVPPEHIVRQASPAALARWVRAQHAKSRHGAIENVPVSRPRWVYPPRRWYWHVWGDWMARQVGPEIARRAELFEPDVMVATRLYPEAYAACSVGRRLGLPVVAIAEGSELLIDLVEQPRAGPILSKLTEGLAGVVFVSHHLKDVGDRLGLHPSRDAVIPNGIDFTMFRPEQPPGGISRQRITALGNHFHVKGIDVLLQAIPALLREAGETFEVVLAGDGPLRSEYEKQARGMGIARIVSFMGGVRHQDVPKLLARTSVLCMPSRSEGLGIAALEAMACGVPVVASSVGGLTEVVDQGTRGFLVEPESPRALAEALARALRTSWDPVSIRAFVLENYDTRAVSQRLAGFMASVVAKNATEEQ